jgi:hypothetical protein
MTSYIERDKTYRIEVYHLEYPNGKEEKWTKRIFNILRADYPKLRKHLSKLEKKAIKNEEILGSKENQQ